MKYGLYLSNKLFQMEKISAIGWMVVTAMLWGVTDPMMKLHGKSLDSQNKNVKSKSSEKGLIFKKC